MSRYESQNYSGGFTLEYHTFQDPLLETERRWSHEFPYLANLKTPDKEYKPFPKYGEHFGCKTVPEFYTNFSSSVEQEGVAIMQVIGLSGSGKTFTSSNIAENLKREGKGIYYLPWADAIRYAQKLKVIDPEKKFGTFTPEEFEIITNVYNNTHAELFSRLRLLKRNNPSLPDIAIIGETIAHPTAISHEGKKQLINRGGSAVHMLSRDYDAYILSVYADKDVKDHAKQFRREIWDTESSDDTRHIARDFGIIYAGNNEHTIDIFKNSGAPASVVDAMESQYDDAIFALRDSGEITLPFYIENRSEHAFRAARERIIGTIINPFVLRSLMTSPHRLPDENRAVIAINHNMNAMKTRYPIEEDNYFKRLIA